MSDLTIGQIARRAGVGIETIRFYERKGLIEEPPRKESGYRQYNEDAITRLAFIQHAKTQAARQEVLGAAIEQRDLSPQLGIIFEQVGINVLQSEPLR